LRDALRLSPLEDRLSVVECLARRRARPLARQHPGSGAPRLPARRNQTLAPGLSLPLLSAEPVQALGTAQRPKDLVGWLALAARRLARPLRRHRDRLAGGTRGLCPRQRE